MKQEDHARNGWRYITAEYLDDDFKHFKMFVRWVFAVFFLPVEEIKGAFENFVDELERCYYGHRMPNSIPEFIAYL